MPKGKVLVVSDEPETRRLLERVLGERGFAVASAASAEEALARVLAEGANVVALDADMSGMGGIHICQELRMSVLIPIILLSSHCEESDIVLSLGMGADYHICKPVRPSELAACAEAAARRELVYSRRRRDQEVHRVGKLVVDSGAHEMKIDGRVIPLSPTEFRLILTLARNAGRILTRDQLLDSVWELRADGIYSRTVDVHIGRIRRKIGDNPASPRYILTVPGIGYKMASG